MQIPKDIEKLKEQMLNDEFFSELVIKTASECETDEEAKAKIRMLIQAYMTPMTPLEKFRFYFSALLGKIKYKIKNW